VTTRRLIGSPPIAALLGIAIVFLASSCGQSTPSATLPTPSAASSPTPSASPSPSPPPGGPVPAQLLGDWFLRTAVVDAIPGFASNVCPSHPTAENCFVQLTLTATTYSLLAPDGGGGADSVVVNHNEIDFFNAPSHGCLDLPNVVGRYKWTLTGGVLHFTLISDPCISAASVSSRVAFVANHSFYRTH
jgi:hypothetical protein